LLILRILKHIQKQRNLKKKKRSKEEKEIKEEKKNIESPENNSHLEVINLKESLPLTTHTSFSSNSSSSPKTSDADAHTTPSIMNYSDSPRGSFEIKGSPSDSRIGDTNSTFGEWQDLEQSIISASDARAKWMELERENQSKSSLSTSGDDSSPNSSLTRKTGKAATWNAKSGIPLPSTVPSIINDRKKNVFGCFFKCEQRRR